MSQEAQSSLGATNKTDHFIIGGVGGGNSTGKIHSTLDLGQNLGVKTSFVKRVHLS